MPTVSVENYLKAILHLHEEGKVQVSTTELAGRVRATPASTSAMLRKLGDKGWVIYRKYRGVHLTNEGRRIAMNIFRRHRLWECFLVDHLGFEWDEVHEIAEELEHVGSRDLTNRLDAFLGFPKLDPHGDAIPGPNGRFRSVAARTLLSEAPKGIELVVVGVVDGRDSFLRHLGILGIALGTRVTLETRHAFDGSLEVRFSENGDVQVLSPSVTARLWVDQSNPEPIIVFPEPEDEEPNSGYPSV
ncbi:MAG: iron-dependent repressor [Crocinitomicaceae bacterium]|nr:iron-dependent repressor [Crocinitomicaceae bacterium]